MQIQPASVGCKVNSFSYVVTMLKLARNNRGFMVERILLVFLIIIALTVGVSQYQKYGIIGVVLGFLITVAGVVAAFFVLFGALDRIGYLHEKLHGKAWYRQILNISKLTLIFLFLSLWSMALKMSSGLTSGGFAGFSVSQSPVHFSAWSSGSLF